MSEAERGFPAFLWSLTRGLYTALLTDPDVFLLGCTARLVGSPSKRLRGPGYTLALYVTLRRFDQYIDVLTQLASLGHLSNEPSNNNHHTHDRSAQA